MVITVASQQEGCGFDLNSGLSVWNYVLPVPAGVLFGTLASFHRLIGNSKMSIGVNVSVN